MNLKEKASAMSEFGIWFSFTSLGYIFGNIINSKLSPKIGLERMCLLGTICSFCTVLIFFINNNLFQNGPLVLSLICMLFGCSNGFAVANSMTGAINSSVSNKGAASGLMGAFQVGSRGTGWFSNNIFWRSSKFQYMFICIIYYVRYFNNILIFDITNKKNEYYINA